MSSRTRGVRQPLPTMCTLLRRVRLAVRRRWRAATDRFHRIHPQPALLMGNQKSGTTAIASLLALSTGRTCTIDPLHRSSPREGEALAEYVLRNRRLFSAAVIKDCSFQFLLDQLRETFPRSPMVLICRDPRQNLRSLLDRMGLRGDKQRLDEIDLQHLDAIGWSWILQGQDETRERNYIDILSERWNASVDAYLENPEQIRLVRYEDFLEDKVECIERLAGSLGWPSVADIRPFCDHQFQPRGARAGLDPPEVFSSDNLSRIETRCASRMRRLGYEVGRWET